MPRGLQQHRLLFRAQRILGLLSIQDDHRGQGRIDGLRAETLTEQKHQKQRDDDEKRSSHGADYLEGP